jgi:hypothetical protein
MALHMMSDRFRWGGIIAAAAVIALAPSPAVAGEPDDPVEILLITNAQSTARRIMAFSPADGSLVSDSFIALPGSIGGVTPSRPLHAIASPWGTVLVTDQLRHVVYEFNWDGSGASIFAPAGGPDNAVLNNIRGMAVLPSGEVLVANNGPTANTDNDHAIVHFDENAQPTPQLIFQQYGGIRGPFDVIVGENMILVSSEGAAHVARFSAAGKFNELFARNLPFPQQLAFAANGNVLVANSSAPSRISEYAADGTLVGQYTAGLSAFRGVHELDNGNLLVTNNTGVHVITRSGQFVQTVFTGSELRYIERVTLPQGVAAARAGAGQATPGDRAKPQASEPPPARPFDAEDERGGA